MKNKRIQILLSLLLVLVIMVSACTTYKVDNSEKTISPVEGKPTVTGTTTFVVDIVDRLAGDFVEIELIIPAGEDVHMYEPKPQDLDKLTESDLVLYQGLNFEGRMVDVLDQLGYEITRNFPRDELHVEDGEKTTVDPHFWFDIDLYKIAVETTADYLSQLIPVQESEIRNKLEVYTADLDILYLESQEKINSISVESRFLITPHDAFSYFSRSFDMPVMAPQGISTDSEVANKDIQNTVDFIVENEIKAIFAETTTDPVRMEKIKEAAEFQGFEVKVVSGEGQELFADSLAPKSQIGDNYIDMFAHNIDLIVNNLK